MINQIKGKIYASSELTKWTRDWIKDNRGQFTQLLSASSAKGIQTALSKRGGGYGKVLCAGLGLGIQLAKSGFSLHKAMALRKKYIDYIKSKIDQYTVPIFNDLMWNLYETAHSGEELSRKQFNLWYQDFVPTIFKDIDTYYNLESWHEISVSTILNTDGVIDAKVRRHVYEQTDLTSTQQLDLITVASHLLSKTYGYLQLSAKEEARKTTVSIMVQLISTEFKGIMRNQVIVPMGESLLYGLYSAGKLEYKQSEFGAKVRDVLAARKKVVQRKDLIKIADLIFTGLDIKKPSDKLLNAVMKGLLDSGEVAEDSASIYRLSERPDKTYKITKILDRCMVEFTNTQDSDDTIVGYVGPLYPQTFIDKLEPRITDVVEELYNGRVLIDEDGNHKASYVLSSQLRERRPLIGGSDIVAGYASVHGLFVNSKCWKADDDTKTQAAIGSVEPKIAILKTVQAYISLKSEDKIGKRIPIWVNHKADQPADFELLYADVDSVGLYVILRATHTPSASADIFSLIKDGTITGFSIGYSKGKAATVDDVWYTGHGGDLDEISLVVPPATPANPAARITAVGSGNLVDLGIISPEAVDPTKHVLLVHDCKSSNFELIKQYGLASYRILQERDGVDTASSVYHRAIGNKNAIFFTYFQPKELQVFDVTGMADEARIKSYFGVWVNPDMVSIWKRNLSHVGWNTWMREIHDHPATRRLFFHHADIRLLSQYLAYDQRDAIIDVETVLRPDTGIIPAQYLLHGQELFDAYEHQTQVCREQGVPMLDVRRRTE